MNKMTALMTMMISLWSLNAVAEDFLVIANEKLGRTSITRKELKDVYLGEKASLSGNVVSPCMLATNDGKAFFSAYLDVSEDKFSQIWIRKELTGAASAPVSRDSIDGVLTYVSTNKGGLGFIPKSAAGRQEGKGIKILDVTP